MKKREASLYLDCTDPRTDGLITFLQASGYDLAVIHQEFVEIPRLDVDEKSYFGTAQIKRSVAAMEAVHEWCEQPDSVDCIREGI